MNDAEDIVVTAWHGFVGQRDLMDRLEIHIDAALARQAKSLAPILLFGPPGCGKTTLGRLIAQRFGRSFEKLLPPIDPRMLRYFAQDDEREIVLLIDEIHRAKASEQEMLYSVLQDGYYEYKGRKFPTEHISVVAATTEGDQIEKPMLDRFMIAPAFVPYTDDEMTDIAVGMMAAIGLPYDWDFAEGIVPAATGTPRRLKPLISMARDLHVIDKPYDVDLVLKMCNVTPDGLTDQHVRYLTFMESQSPNLVGLDLLSMQLDLGKGMVKDLERLFINRRWIERHPKGRDLTQSGIRRAKELRKENA